MTERKPLVIFGDTGFAEIACEYFNADSGYEVRAFAVEEAFLGRPTVAGLPVYPLESLETCCPPERYSFFAAATYTQRNGLRRRIYLDLRRRGYPAASFVSPRAFVWKNCVLGEHCFVFENNVVQPFVRIGANVVLWSGNHIGHHSVIGDHCFVSSHVVISGNCRVGEGCFFGVNATVSNDLSIGAEAHIGPCALVLADVPDQATVIGTWTGRKAPRDLRPAPEAKP